MINRKTYLLKVTRASNMRSDGAWEDTDEITFGKYKGTAMKKVPASYLLWLWNNGMWRDTLSNRYDPCRLYIIKNFHALETECPDVIIDHRP